MLTNQDVERSKAGNGQVVRGVSPIGKELTYLLTYYASKFSEMSFRTSDDNGSGRKCYKMQ